MKNKTTAPRTTVSSVTVTGTRDAVETAIDLSKGLSRGTWESSAKTSLGRFARWEDEVGSAVTKPD